MSAQDPQRMDYPQTYPSPTLCCAECGHNELVHFWDTRKKCRTSCSVHYGGKCQCKRFQEPSDG